MNDIEIAEGIVLVTAFLLLSAIYVIDTIDDLRRQIRGWFQ